MYRGIFNVRIKPDLHRELTLYSLRSNSTLNAVVESAIDRFLHDTQSSITNQLCESVMHLSKTVDNLALTNQGKDTWHSVVKCDQNLNWSSNYGGRND